MIGLFAISEVFKLVESSGDVAPRKAARISGSYLTWRETKGLVPTMLRSSVIGTAVGAVPGAGAMIASLISWNTAKRISKTPEKFGTGIMEGVCASEAANNASVGGAMIPLLTLGAPGSGTTAVMLGGLMVHGVNPGPLLVIENPELVYAVYAGLLLSAGAMLVLRRARLHDGPVRVSTRSGGSGAGPGLHGGDELPQGPRALRGDHTTFVTSLISLVLLTLAVLSFAIPVVKNHIAPAVTLGPDPRTVGTGEASSAQGVDSTEP